MLGLQDLVATLDQRHWERQTEINRDKRATTSNSTNPTNKPAAATDNRSGNQTAGSSKSNNNNNQQQQQSNNKDQKKPAAANSSSTATTGKTKTIANLLGPDGKLKPEERKRRFDNNLCLRCGGPGHTVLDCPQTKKPKGRAATTTTPAATSSGSNTGAGKA